MAKYVGRSKQRFYAKNSGKDYGKLFSCHCSMWHIVVLWQAAKGMENIDLFDGG